MTPPQPYLDPRAIENLRTINPDDGGEFLRELIDIFLADTPQRITEIEQAIAAKHAGNLTRAAHSIKGSSGNFGAMQLSVLARDLEAQGKAGDFDGARANLAALRSEFEQLLPVLEKLKQGA
jgi:HPt (histidine-containing phosphotransfer) domain-containing protein